jgi:hypothetical protein
MAATAVTLEITDVTIYPNPYKSGDIKIQISLTRQCSRISYKIYTDSFRLIRFGAETVNFSAGKNDLIIKAYKIKGLANGTYYMTFAVEDSLRNSAKSGIKTLIIIK